MDGKCAADVADQLAESLGAGYHQALDCSGWLQWMAGLARTAISIVFLVIYALPA
jgi:hypothetical protein